MKSIRKRIRDLHWDKPRHVQENAVKKLSKLSGEDAVTLAKHTPDFPKPCWENAALALQKIGYPEIKEALPYMMEWFQDINWPGTEIFVDIFRTIDPAILQPHIEAAAISIKQENDESWALGILQLIHRLDMTSLFKDDFFKDLEMIADYSYRDRD